MSERNQVYKEIDQLEEKLSTSEQRSQRHQREGKVMAEELETLRREIKSALQDRDHAMKEVSTARPRHERGEDRATTP